MSTTNLTGTDVNGVFQVSAVNNVTSDGGATSESILLYSSGALRASDTSNATLDFVSCNIFLNDVSGTAGNPNATALSYNGDSTDRGDNGSYINFVDSSIIYLTSGSRRNIFVSELTRTNVIEQDSGSQLFVYTQPNATLNTVIMQGINTWEVVGQFTEAFNITIDDVTKSYLNWEAGRLDFFGLGVINKPTGSAQADAWLGTGASNNAAWQWNNKSTFNNEKLYLTATTNRYYDGVTISWEFTDRDTGSAIQNVKMKVKDDFPGSAASGTMAERGEYLSNSSGHITGTWDSQNRSTVATGDRNTFFMVRNAVTRIDTNSNLSGTKTYPATIITGDQGDRGENYELDEVLNEIELKAYLYEARAGFIDGDTFDSTVQIGVLASDVSVDEYATLIMSLDPGITQTTKATVDAYTTIDDLDRFYDRTKAEWWDNAGYPLPTNNGEIMDLDDVDVIIDGSASAAFTFSGGDITINPATDDTFEIGATNKTLKTTGVVTSKNGAVVGSGMIIDGDFRLESAEDLDGVIITGDLVIATGANSEVDFTDVTVSGDVTNGSAGNTLTINQVGGSFSTSEAGTGNGEVEILNIVPIKVVVKDAKTQELLEGAQVLLVADTGGDLPSGESVTITRVSTTATVAHTAHGLKDGDSVQIAGANQIEYRGEHVISLIDANSYSYTVSGSPTTPATGTITSTAQIVNTDTDEFGEVNVDFNYTSDQPIKGRARKATP